MSDILIVLADRELRRKVAGYLEANGLGILQFAGVQDIDRMRASVGLILLDAELPDGVSLATCRRLAESSGPAVILMGSGHDEIERIVGLEVGAEDYVAKTVHPRELLARVRVALRRSAASVRPVAASTYASRGLELDIVHRQLVMPGRKPLRLTPAEVSMLAVFIQREGEPVSRADLKAVVARSDRAALDGAVDTQISRLRRKLNDYVGVELIQTIHGVGYVWNAVFGPSRSAAPAAVEALHPPRRIRAV
jgi:two-component system OmpR family response regulator